MKSILEMRISGARLKKFKLTLAVAILNLRAGALRQASSIYLKGTWLYVTVVIVQNGGIRSSVLALNIAIPVSAAWLLGRRISLFASASCIGSALIFAALDVAGFSCRAPFRGHPSASAFG